MSRLVDADPEKYDWVCNVSGLGHLNMNPVKTFSRICDEIFLNVLGDDVLNFSSNTAYQYFRDAKDNHKAWQSFEVLLHGMVMEMMHVYIKHVGIEDANAKGFLQWQSNTDSATFKLLSQVILNVGIAIYVQRVGDRNNDFKVSHAGRMKFLGAFYGFNHPIYREVEYRELRNLALFPPDVLNLRKQNLSFSKSDLPLNNQGGDFMLEQKVKKLKMFAPKGGAQKEMW